MSDDKKQTDLADSLTAMFSKAPRSGILQDDECRCKNYGGPAMKCLCKLRMGPRASGQPDWPVEPSVPKVLEETPLALALKRIDALETDVALLKHLVRELTSRNGRIG